MEKVIVMIPEVKRATLGSKVSHKNGLVSFKTKSGKKMAIPSGNLLLQDSKSITFKLYRRKFIKGDLEISKNGFIVDDELDIMVNPCILAMGEEKAPMTKEQKKAAEKRAAAMKKARDSKKDKPGKKIKMKKKK